VATLSALEELLESWPGCVIAVSHDRWFLDRVATAILAFEANGVVTLWEGSYSFYAERRPRPATREKAEKQDRPKPVRTQTAPRKLTFKEKQELAGMEAAITSAEHEVAELEATLSDPSVFKDRPTEVQTLVASLDAARAEVERLFARWQELEAIPKE
jgi:ATP-binding cassette subfamily F protein uup